MSRRNVSFAILKILNTVGQALLGPFAILQILNGTGQVLLGHLLSSQN